MEPWLTIKYAYRTYACFKK